MPENEIIDLATTAARLNNLHGAVEAGLCAAIAAGIEAGELLIQIKERLDHGQFGKWIEAHCAFTPRHARRYMEMARHKDEIGHASPKSLRGALAAIADDTRESWLRRAVSLLTQRFREAGYEEPRRERGRG